MTEQDVINEEMYEEEDDDLPLQYRRLTAHLQTGSADFNRRLAAYLTNQVAMRSAVGQMVNGPYGPQYPSAGAYAHGMYPSPMLPQQQQHQMPQSPNGTYRPGPYPSPHHPGFRQMHGRAYSMALPSATSNPPTPIPASLDHRRMSTPTSVHPGAPGPINTEDARPDIEYLRQTQSATIPHGSYPPTWQHMSPFTSTLPPESQQMLAGAPGFDPNDPMSSMLLHGSEAFMSNPYYPWGDMQHGVKGMPVHPSAYPGMSATLAPAALESNNDSMSATPTTSGSTAMDGGVPSSGLDLGFSGDNKGLSINLTGSRRDHSPNSAQSGQVTPGEGFWDNFVQDSSWYDDNTTTCN